MIFYTVCDTNYLNMAHQWANSVHKFYPTSPIHIYIVENYRNQAGKTIGLAGKDLSQFDKVTYMNPDNIVCSLLPDDFGDIAMPRNNTEYQFHPSITYYMNCGLVMANHTIWKDYLQEFSRRGEAYGEEQNAFNVIFWSGRYKTVILDDESNCYGALELSSYFNAQVINNQLVANGKVIRVFHAAGSDFKDGNQYLFNKLPKDVSNYLLNLTKG